MKCYRLMSDEKTVRYITYDRMFALVTRSTPKHRIKTIVVHDDKHGNLSYWDGERWCYLPREQLENILDRTERKGVS